MTEHHALTAESILWALPDVLRNDADMFALATAITEELNEMVSKTSLPNIYSNIDTLDEALLDIMARDFKIDWWRADASVEWKRRMVKSCWFVHRHLGTPAAVKAALAEFLGKGIVQEWFEYDGIPHHFRIRDCDNDEVLRNYSQFISILRIVKRRSSVLDKVTALLEQYQRVYIGIALRMRKEMYVESDSPDLSGYEILTDENDEPLITPDGGLLYL